MREGKGHGDNGPDHGGDHGMPDMPDMEGAMEQFGDAMAMAG